MITSPAAESSNAAAFAVACGKLLSVISDAPASAQVGAGYSGTLTVSGGSGGYTWAATGLPAGLTASPGGPALTVSGSPRTAGTFTAEVTVHDTARPDDAGTARGLPRGMTAAPHGDTLVIAGTPAVTGDFPVTVSVSDTEPPAQTGTGRLVLVVDAPAP
ncbi:MAG TPA: putative Ig domain-containing protein [Streptosporangiaceae bacterium]|nr:putative Ig domain-containing protein [Streptosporangiaceae bacterium]